MTGRLPVLLHSAFYSALRRQPAERRSRFRRLAERLATGRWGGGTRVKKLRGVAKPVFEARHDDGDRVLFTLARSAAPDGSGLATYLQVWDLVAHDRVSAAAARVNRAPEAEFLDYDELESETTDGPPPHPGATFDEVPAAGPGAPAGVLELMLAPEDIRLPDREEITGGVRWYLLPERLLVADGEWQALMDGGNDELELKLTSEQYGVVRVPGPLLLSGSAGSGKTTVAVHRLAAACAGPARVLYLTYSSWLRDHARRLFDALRATRGGEPGLAPDFLTVEELYRRLLGPGGEGEGRVVDYPEFARWYGDAFRRSDAALAWEEIRSILKGACLDAGRELLRRDEYEALGRKRAPLFAGERPRLYEVARRWQDRLRAAGRVDEIDLCRRALAAHRARPSRWDQVVCDEAQDLAEIQVELLLRLHRGERLEGLFLAGDPQQVINPSGFRWAEVRTAIRERLRALGRPAPALTSLTRNFRSVRGVVELAGEILAVKRERTGRSDGDETEEAAVAGATPVRVEGSEEELAAVVAGFGPRCAVLVGSAAAAARLQSRLDTTRIFTVPDAKGLEFDVVVLWGLVAADPGPWARLLDPALDLREDPACRRALHHLYVAVTRARRHLAVYEPAGAPALWTGARFATRLEVEPARSLERLFVHAARPAEWLKEAEYFLERGRPRQAAECFRRAGEARRETECLALHHERAGDGLAAGRLWLELDELARAARCFEEVEAWSDAAALWHKLEDATATQRCWARAAEGARDWAAAGLAWEALSVWAEAARCWGNVGQRSRQLRCLGEADEAQGRWPEAARRWEEVDAWDRAATAWQRGGRPADARRAEALGHEARGRWGEAARAWGELGDHRRAALAAAAAFEAEERWADAARLWEQIGEAGAAARAWRRAGQPRDAALCEARADLAAGRAARAAEALETLGDLEAAAQAWARAQVVGQAPTKGAPLVLPAGSTRRWTEGGRPARLHAAARARRWRSALAPAERDARIRGLACRVCAAEAAGRLEEAESLWAELGDPHQALRCRVQRLEREGRFALAAALLEEHGLFEGAGRAWTAVGETSAATRCEAKRLDKKRRWEEAAALWTSLGDDKSAALCRARLSVSRADYAAAASAFEEAGERDLALDLRILEADRVGDLPAAIALAESGGRHAQAAFLRQRQAAGASSGSRRNRRRSAEWADPLSTEQKVSTQGAGPIAGGTGLQPARPRTTGPTREDGTGSDMTRLMAAIAERPGARSLELERRTGLRPPRLGVLLRQAVAAGLAVKSGATRGTRYWPPPRSAAAP